MDPVTHGLASFTLSRACFPRAPRLAVAAILLAGTVADLDHLSSLFGPSAFFAAHRTITHSLVGAFLIAVLIAGIYILFGHRFAAKLTSGPTIILAAFLAAVLHVALDVCQSEGVALLWPLRDTRYSLDWIARIDPWILVILLAGILLPALFRLITEEIGAQAKSPRGRVGARLALAVLVAYLGARMILHSNAVGVLLARTYHGQLARRAAAFPEAASPFSWHGLVETESALHQVPVNVGPGANFDPEAGSTLFKPEPSPWLDAARASSAAQRFLRFARFPRATVTRIEDGYRCELRDLRYSASGEAGGVVAVVVEMDAGAKVRAQRFVWQRELSTR